MLILLSPAKTLDFERRIPDINTTGIQFSAEAQELTGLLKTKSVKELRELMHISDKLAQLNAERFLLWHWPFDEFNVRAAIYAFKGEVYSGLEVDTMQKDAVDYAQKSVRILSGLYGVLRPFDAIMPYRLEMGTKLLNSKGKDLYSFWGDKLTRAINDDLKSEKHQALVNLASQEYYKTIDEKKIERDIITPVFKEFKSGQYKVISIYAKKARGLMTRFIVENRLTNPEDLKAFDLEGYVFNNELSKGTDLVFTRR
ncbi:peroxide stress protein YaaA [Alkalitalea saponilacus]|uniref:UPF0246 protein SAMN03080601_03104 n=1 Tax=Alkalitalea saponilacus TaxID=889453 RepID=A0A1T5HT05_9BACT|nr:peroxide stress protein YaaA [Alkalitalea saponilacus]ASB47676.1 hypothetical protein CDL62_00160 [Alkalitalea saponilacus]SKC23819.1 hypothetical protein SAMN03080601_03104 [Alkalitalea saponilacus]